MSGLDARQPTDHDWRPYSQDPEFEATRKGAVRRNGAECPLRSNGKYLYVRGCSRKNLYVHAIVADCFIGQNDSRSDVNHIDGNKLNNCAENLEYCTRSENMIHAKIQKQNKTSIFKGVSLKEGKWRARHREKHLGQFRLEAHAAYVHDLAVLASNDKYKITNFSYPERESESWF